MKSAKQKGTREVAAGRREAARDYYATDNDRERRQAIREGARKVRSAKRKAGREVRSEQSAKFAGNCIKIVGNNSFRNKAYEID